MVEFFRQEFDFEAEPEPASVRMVPVAVTFLILFELKLFDLKLVELPSILRLPVLLVYLISLIDLEPLTER